MDIRKFSVEPTARLHLRDANDELMFADGADGNPDQTKPIAVHVFGPGSKMNAKAQAAQQNRYMQQLKRKGKTDQTPEQIASNKAQLLADCTQSFENLDYDGLTGPDLAIGVYSDVSLGFIGDQVAKFLGDWANFSKVSAPT